MEQRRRSLESLHFDPSKCVRQPRSNLPRRPSRRGFFTMISRWEDVSLMSTAKANESSPGSLSVSEEIEIRMARCNISSMEPSISNTAEVGHVEVESADGNAPLDSFINGSFGQYHSNCARSLFPAQPLPFTLEINDDAWLAPGSVVWAKIDSNPWWPAEIMDDKGATDQSNEGLVLVRLYGSCEYAWIDPVRGLSRFNYCYEERSSNPLKAFQDALQQALHTKEDASSSEHSDKCDISSSSRTTDDYIHRGRGKRKHKPKIHFDELTTPEKSIRKVRRMRIMRYLGLTAPVGSPFTQPRARHGC